MPAPTFSFDDLISPVSKEDVQASIYSVLSTVGVDVTVWKSGSVVRTIVAGVSIVLAQLSTYQALIVRSGFLALSEGPWLKLVAHYVYGVDFFAATFATGVVTLTNSLGGVYGPLDPGDLIFSAVVNGVVKNYTNTAVVNIPAMSVVTNVAISAVEVGSASSAPAAAISTLVTTLNGVTVTNPSALVGLDEESDVALRQRCALQLGALSPLGPWDAYLSAALNAVHTDGSSIGVTRSRIVKDGTGNVYIYLATASGVVASPELALADDAIQRFAAPLAVTAHTLSATGFNLSVTYTAWVYNTVGKTDSQVRAVIFDALSAYVAALPVGGIVVDSDPGRVFHDALLAVIFEALPEIFHVEISVPGGNTDYAGANYVALLGAVTGTINQEPPANGFPG